MRYCRVLAGALLLALWSAAQAQMPQGVVDIRSRPGVTQRMIVVAPSKPKAAVVLLAGGHGGLQVFRNGSVADVPAVMGKLRNAPRKQLVSFKGGATSGDPCEALAYHGFNGLEADVVQQIAAWVTAN